MEFTRIFPDCDQSLTNVIVRGSKFNLDKAELMVPKSLRRCGWAGAHCGCLVRVSWSLFDHTSELVKTFMSFFRQLLEAQGLT